MLVFDDVLHCRKKRPAETTTATKTATTATVF